jgi:hypothetical protein
MRTNRSACTRALSALLNDSRMPGIQLAPSFGHDLGMEHPPHVRVDRAKADPETLCHDAMRGGSDAAR